MIRLLIAGYGFRCMVVCLDDFCFLSKVVMLFAVTVVCFVALHVLVLGALRCIVLTVSGCYDLLVVRFAVVCFFYFCLVRLKC